MKKLLLAVPMVLLLAAGCNSGAQSQSSSTNNYGQDQQTSPTPTPSMAMPTAMGGSQSSTPSSWQGTLMSSNNSTKGKYMIQVSGHNIYLNTGRDYSTLLGKMVNVSYTGNLTNFTLGEITAQ